MEDNNGINLSGEQISYEQDDGTFTGLSAGHIP